MNLYNDICIDIETGGISPDHAPIIQIAAVRFDLKTRTIDSDDMFDRCLYPLPGRFWEESTRQWWWGKNRAVLDTILPRREDPKLVLEDFWNWCVDGSSKAEPLRVWAKPISFDLPLLASHFKQIGKETPWHYRWACDLNSFVRGMAHDPNAPLIDTFGEFHGSAHNALMDAINQVGRLFAAMDHYHVQPGPLDE